MRTTLLSYMLCLTSVAGVSLVFFLLWPWPLASLETMPLPELGQDVEWQLYRNTVRLETHSTEQRQVNSLKWNSERFPEGLQRLQLSCHSGEEGILLHKYGTFLQSLDEYAVFHREAGQKEGVRTLMWMCDVHQYCGGLADRLKGITFSLLVAMFTRRRLLLSWGSSIFGEQSFLKPNMIDWFVPTEKIHLTHLRDSESGASEDMQKVFFFSMFSILGGIGVDKSAKYLEFSLSMLNDKLTNIALATNMDPSDLKNRTKSAGQQWIIEGLRRHGLDQLSSQEIKELVGIVFRYLFQFTDELIANVSSAHRALGLGHQKYVGVHIRTGFAGSPSPETVKHPKLIRKMQDWEAILKCAVDTSRSLLGPTSVIFLATDSTLVKRIAVDKYDSQVKTMNHTLAHLDRMSKFPHKPYIYECEGTLASWVDFILLAEAYLQVRTLRSGFSAVAGQLCMLPSSRAINGLLCVLP